MSGEMPGGWASARMADVVRIVTDGVTAEDLAKIPEVYHYSLPAFDAWGQPDIGPGASIKSNKTIVPSDCVLFSKLNPRIPRIWRVRKSASAHSYCSTEFWPLVRRADQIDLDFLAHIVGSERFLGDPAIAPSSSTNSHQRVDRKSFEGFHLLLPPLDEQRRIAEVLRAIDEAIEAATIAYEQARTAFAATRTSLTGLDGSKPDWTWGPILDFFQLQRGHDLPVQDRIAGEVPVIASNGTVGFHNVSPVSAPSVVTGRSGTIGKVNYFDGACWPLNTTLFVKDFKGSNPRYVYHFLSAFPLGDYQTGTGVPTLNRNDVHVVEVSWPDRGEQDDIVAALDALESVAMTMKQESEALRGLKSQVAADLLSGRVRVPA